MLLFLYGEDTYRLGQKINEIINGYKKIHHSGLDLKFLDCKNLDFREFKDELQTTSMFKERKLFILENVFLNSEFEKNFLDSKNFLRESKEIILIYKKGEINKKNSLFKFLIKYAKTQEFKLLEGAALKRWVRREVERYGAEIDFLAVEQLINFTGNNLWQLSNEIKKLVCFKASKKIIKAEDLELLVVPEFEQNIFKTIDAVVSKNKRKAFFLIYKQLKKGDSLLYILSMIVSQVRNLLIIKERYELSMRANLQIDNLNLNKLSKELGMHPYVAKKALWQAQKFSLEKLRKIFQKFFQIDFQIKTGQIDPETALTLLVAEI